MAIELSGIRTGLQQDQQAAIKKSKASFGDIVRRSGSSGYR